ncbi:GNAT family N-acetyltransferase [Halobacillus salinus]|uniref:GNAT family N-acetyltransferase n=1 Tax=Halobacillus salinus TaxID=192814 RepID=A0A4Z0H933_9BACI|nr:GNAT family N-acetyltransferase [Halobacillus salinus]TGB05356.1 GNAT family N-acetyltransferase [Halobacillus salinus]
MQHLKPTEASLYITLLEQLESESEFLLFEPGERQMSENQAKAMIESFREQGNSTIIGVMRNGELVGHITCLGGQARRNCHAVKLVIGVKKEYRGEGIASSLFDCAIKWAEEKELKRLELMVMTHNEQAIGLYEKYDFQIEGVKKNSLKVSGDWVDEYIMARILP